ncbi:hypothetical protein YYC_02868 [Plasmodium yoelii 17X]|uniref:YIR protein n=1 Tax=Plasmodium yoelii 17X TaxID=1323249 RepID=V7PK29_PLAYE|nr:hypothetical protein YYC_02868 [Plasmodium yoelii 17X]
MDDDLCGKFGSLRQYLPDDLDQKSSLDFHDNSKFVKYCPDKNCNTDLEQIGIGFLWLLEEYFTKYLDKGSIEKNAKPFFLYIISWLSYKLNKKSKGKFTTINDFYTNHVNRSDKYKKFRDDSSKFTSFNEFIDEQKYLFDINIEDLSKFYDAFKLICDMYGNVETNKHENLPNNANDFINKYTELNNNCNIKGAARSKIFSALSTNYDNFKNYCTSKGIECKDFSSLPEITEFSALTSGYTSSSSIGNKLFTVLSIFGAIAFFLGISYKYSLFGFRKRAQKQYLREKIKKIKKKINH